MKFFITGASGFIGKSLIDEILLDKRNFVYALSQKKARKKLENNSSIKWIKGNLKSNLKKYLQKTDILVHLAAKFDNDFSNKIYETNLIDSLYLFEQARNQGVKNFIAAGSGFENGSSNNKIKPLSLFRPVGDYQSSKAIFNIKICNWAKNYKLNMTYMKIFQVYGKGENKRRLYPQIVDCAKKNRRLKINKNSKKIIRDFIKLEDVVKDILYQVRINKGVNVSNCCSGKKMSVYEFSRYIWKKFSDKKPKIMSTLNTNINPMSNFGLKKTINIDKIEYTIEKIKF